MTLLVGLVFWAVVVPALVTGVWLELRLVVLLLRVIVAALTVAVAPAEARRSVSWTDDDETVARHHR